MGYKPTILLSMKIIVFQEYKYTILLGNEPTILKKSIILLFFPCIIVYPVSLFKHVITLYLFFNSQLKQMSITITAICDAYQFSSDEDECNTVSTRSNCFKFHASDGNYL